jgi:hypothetical protein
VKMTNTIQIRMTTDNINMKNKKSNIFVTNFGMLTHLLSDGYYYGIVGVKAESEDKYNAEIEFKYG